VSCGAQDDIIEHTIFSCNRWLTKKKEHEQGIGSNINPVNIVTLMLRDMVTWDAVEQYNMTIMTTKGEEERTRQQVVH